MLTSKYMRIVSILGIIALLSLQYVWLRNAYQMVEREIMVNCKESLKEAINEELYKRLNTKTTFYYDSSTGNDFPGNPKSKTVVKGEVNKSSELNIMLQEALTIIGRKCSVKNIDSIYCGKINQKLGFIPEHSIRIINDSVRDSIINKSNIDTKVCKPNEKFVYRNDTCKIIDFEYKNTIINKLDSKRSVELNITSPNKSVIAKAKYIFIVSIFLVLMIGIILVLQLKSMIKDKEFTKFMKDYTRILAHEFRTPINDIYLLTSSIMNNKDLSPEKIALYNQEKLNQCSKMLLGIDNLLLLAKSEQTKLAAHKTLTDMRLFINKIADKYRNSGFLRKNLKIETNFTPEDCHAYIDPDLMENVLVNLVENAIKYSNEDVEVLISCTFEDKQLILKIKDNGFGISKSDQKHIFQIFERGKKISGNQIKGFGIGLYYVSLAVKAHQGKVEILSEEGKGSEFVIIIPNRFL